MAEEKKQQDVDYLERKGQTPKGERMVEVTSRRPPSLAQKKTGEGD